MRINKTFMNFLTEQNRKKREFYELFWSERSLHKKFFKQKWLKCAFPLFQSKDVPGGEDISVHHSISS